MASITESTSLAQSNGHPPLQIRIYRPSDWKQLKPIFMAGIIAPLPSAVRHMYTWPSFYPVYALVGGGVAWLGRAAWKVVNRLGLQAFRMKDSWSWMRHVSHGTIKDWSWRESAALGSIGLGLVTWGVNRYKVHQAFHQYVQMSLNTDLRDIPEHYKLERVPLPETNTQAEGEEWRPKGASAFWVAEIGGEVVGCIGLDQRDDGPYGAAGELRRMAVSSRFHRRGIARRLLEQLIDYGKRHGVKKVYLYTTQFQAPAIGLYQNAGFQFVKDMPLVGTARLLMFNLDL